MSRAPWNEHRWCSMYHMSVPTMYDTGQGPEQHQFVYKQHWHENRMYNILTVLSTSSLTTTLLSWMSTNVIFSIFDCVTIQVTPLTNLCHKCSAILRRIFFSLLWTACRWRALKQVLCTEHKKLSMINSWKLLWQWRHSYCQILQRL